MGNIKKEVYVKSVMLLLSIDSDFCDLKFTSKEDYDFVAKIKNSNLFANKEFRFKVLVDEQGRAVILPRSVFVDADYLVYVLPNKTKGNNVIIFSVSQLSKYLKTAIKDGLVSTTDKGGGYAAVPLGLIRDCPAVFDMLQIE